MGDPTATEPGKGLSDGGFVRQRHRHAFDRWNPDRVIGEESGLTFENVFLF
ncbi:hypothetical protein [Wenxinia marina]|uniref:hypothetical protein n=1 Tax=Wenxinia marina TaxID=390641 RepID=UPI0003A1BD0B|nr:hypothetical protein [Wenxinia marina]